MSTNDLTTLIDHKNHILGHSGFPPLCEGEGTGFLNLTKSGETEIF